MNTAVSTMPATSGGKNARAKRYAGAVVESGAPARRAFADIATSAIVAATAASASQMAIQRVLPSGGPVIAAVAMAETPMPMPPQPGTAVKALARSIASRI